MVPSTSTDKSVCATSTLPRFTTPDAGEAGVAQTLLSVLSQGAASDPDNHFRVEQKAVSSIL
jgi:hypothetical protein